MRTVIMCLLWACNSAICYAGLTNVIQTAIGPGTKGYAVIILIGISIARWILTTLCRSFGHETIAGGVDIILKCAAVYIVIDAVWSLVDGTFVRMGF